MGSLGHLIVKHSDFPLKPLRVSDFFLPCNKGMTPTRNPSSNSPRSNLVALRGLYLFTLCLSMALFAMTGCQLIKGTVYEPIPLDQVAQEQGVTLAEAEALNLQQPRAELQPIINTATAFVPGYGQLASVTLNGILGLGAIWLGRKKHTADKVATSLVQGIDTFRDIIDQTPQGEQIDARLTETLRDHQNALQVQKEITKLLERYQTPTKTPIDLGA